MENSHIVILTLIVSIISSLVTIYFTHFLKEKSKEKQDLKERKRNAYIEVLSSINYLSNSTDHSDLVALKESRGKFALSKLKLKLFVSTDAYNAIEKWANDYSENRDANFEEFIELAQKDIQG